MSAIDRPAPSVLTVAFAHHIWATERLLDSCGALTGDQLTTSLAGLFGSPLNTLRHIVGSDAWYLAAVTDGAYVEPNVDDASLAQLGEEIARHTPVWQSTLERAGDGSRIISQSSDGGWTTTAPLAVRFAQALHHGSDHRSQICTALTLCGVVAPEIDLWDFGAVNGVVVDIPPGSSN